MKNILVILLVIIATIMIILGAKAGMIPPILTGVGFILIGGMFLLPKKR